MTQHVPPSSSDDGAGRAAGSPPDPIWPAATEPRRLAVARAIVHLIRRAIVDPQALHIVLEDDAAHGPALEVAAEDGAGAERAARRSAAPRAIVVVRGPDALSRLVLPPTPDAFAEAYLRGDIEIDGDVIAAFEVGQTLDLRRLGADGVRRLARWSWELRRGRTAAPSLQRVARVTGERHSRARDMAAVRFHYDVGNSFYRLWLDRRLTYSCAYFPNGTTARTAAARLDRAQEAKLDLICRKVGLGEGGRLLDIGSGWGSLINFAGERHGAEVVGVTLSERQSAEANARAAAAGQADRVRSMVLDYRDMADLGEFDAVASVGMFEHVGRANLAAYFRAAHAALRPGGLFLNHGIATAEPSRRVPLGPDFRPQTSHFIDRFVFPDGELVAVEEAVAVARAAGFEVLDVQSLRAHYALTLAAWIARLEAHWAEAVTAAGEEVARTWRLYMSGARLGFERGDLDVCQLLLARRDGVRPAKLALRPWW